MGVVVNVNPFENISRQLFANSLSEISYSLSAEMISVYN